MGMDQISLNHKAKKPYTLAFLFQNDQVLLGFKKYGFGKDKWNGFGGKLEKEETIKDAAVREIEEECSVMVKPEDLTQCGIICFEYVDNPTVMKVHVFKCEKFKGDPEESEEMLPKWFPADDLPYDQMWGSIKIWYPLLRQGHKFQGHFLSQEHSKYLKYIIVDFDEPTVVLNSKGCA